MLQCCYEILIISQPFYTQHARNTDAQKKKKKIIKQLEEADFHFTIIISVSLSMFV